VRDRVVWWLTIGYALVFTLLGAWRYAVHRNFVDFGIFAQTTSSAFGCFCNTIEGSHWAFHFSPMLYIVGAIVRLVHSPITLIALQAIAGAFAIPPIAAIVAARSDARTARLSAVVVALYPALAGLVFNDFHENGFAPDAVIWTLWAFDSGRLRLALLFAAWTLLIKEDQAIFLAIAAGIAAWRFRGTTPGRAAIFVAGASVTVLALYFFRIQPHAAALAHWAPTRFYDWTSSDLASILPGAVGRIGFVALAFAPLLFLPFRSRMMWLAGAPLAEVLLSRMSTTYTLGSHYAGAWIGYALVAFAFAVRRMETQRARTALLWCIGLCVLEFVIADPLHPGLNLRAVQSRDVALDRVLDGLPSNASVATQEEAYTHLALSDPNATLLPEDPALPTRACFILIDRDFPESPRLVEYGPALSMLLANGTYRAVRSEGAIQLEQRAEGCT
jgi:uncharacterized membrane protein